MITLILSSANGIDFGVILGYILSGLEVLIVALTLISFFVPSDCKFGKALSFILKGLYKSKDYVNSVGKEDDVKGKEDDTNESNSN